MEWTASGNQGLQAADILVFMDLVSHHNGYKLCDSGKQQIRMECILIWGLIVALLHLPMPLFAD